MHKLSGTPKKTQEKGGNGGTPVERRPSFNRKKKRRHRRVIENEGGMDNIGTGCPGGELERGVNEAHGHYRAPKKVRIAYP